MPYSFLNGTLRMVPTGVVKVERARGNWGHAGRPGFRGGSAPGGGSKASQGKKSPAVSSQKLNAGGLTLYLKADNVKTGIPKIKPLAQASADSFKGYIPMKQLNAAKGSAVYIANQKVGASFGMAQAYRIKANAMKPGSNDRRLLLLAADQCITRAQKYMTIRDQVASTPAGQAVKRALPPMPAPAPDNSSLLDQATVLAEKGQPFPDALVNLLMSMFSQEDNAV